MLTGTVERFEGGYPEDGCIFIMVLNLDTGDTLEINDTTYNSSTGEWTATIENPGESTAVEVIVTDSCWAEQGIFNDEISSSFMTDLGTDTMEIISGIRPEFDEFVITPNPGYIEDSYEFAIVYINGRNNAPSSIVVNIDGVEYILSADNPGDIDYTDGADFSTIIDGDVMGRDIHSCFVYAVDTEDRPGWSDTLEFEIQNHPPVLDTAWIAISPNPDTARENSILTCEIGTVTDSEYDPVEVVYNWFIDGELIEGHTANTLDGDYFDKHNEVWCVVSIYDGFDYGDSVETEHIIIENTPPTAPEIAIDPDEPFDFESVSAIISGESEDADDDDVEYQYEWRVDGISVSSETVLSSDLTTTGDNCELIVWTFDGEDYGGADTLEFYIGGPILSDGAVEPTEGHASTEFEYTVIYTNSRNYPPEEVCVNIDGDLYMMSPLNPEDTDYTDGAIFTYTTTLAVGEHQFRFSATDDHSDVAIGMEDYIVGPSVWNTLPVIDAVSIIPYPDAMVVDDITASVTAWHDDDGDAVSFSYQWYRNGELVEGLTSQVVSGTNFVRGDEVWCEITPFDSYEYGEPVHTEIVTIVNTPPDPPELGIYPESPFSFEDIEAVIENPSFDADGDEVTYSFYWYREDYLVEEDVVLNSEYTSTGQSWWLAVLPYDSYDYGDTAWFNFDIAGPTLTDGYVNPASGLPTQVFAYQVTYSNSRNYAPEYVQVDIDGELFDMEPLDPEDEDFTDGAIYTYETSLEYGTEHSFRFFAEDEYGNPAIGLGDYMSGPVITNNPPVVEELEITPYPEGTVLDEYRVNVISWYDLDGHDVIFQYRWYRNGEEIEDEITSTISGSEFAKGDVVWCDVTPYDGYDLGETVSTPEVDVVNAAPVIVNPFIDITPAGEPTELSTLTATADEIYDPDDDSIILSYKWFINGEELEVGSHIGAITGDKFDRGDTVYAEITVSDIELFTTVTTDEVVIGNALPVVEEFGIEPSAPYTDDELLAYLDYYDPDDDEVTVEYIWRRDGEFMSSEDRIPADMTRHYEIWSLEIRLTDGFDPEEYTGVYDTVEILNSPPEFDREFIDTFAIAGLEYRGFIPVIDKDFDYLTFELESGPDGFEVRGDGSLLWDEVPESDELTVFEDITINISDGDAEIQLVFDLWVYPLSHQLFAPTNLNATSGFTGLIPLNWDPPAAFTVIPYLPVSFIGYEVYRSTDPEAEDWELLTTRAINNAVDTDVEPYTVYYYYVVAVYEVAPSSPSNVDYAFSSPGEITDWYSVYTYDTAPTIDGVIDEGEWNDAMLYSYTIDEYDCRLMFMNKAGYLYVAFENLADATLSDDDMFMLNIDDNDNDRWPSSPGSNEGEYRIKQTEDEVEVTYQGIWGTFPGDIGRDVRTTIAGLLGNASDENGYVSYELAIPIGSDVGYLNLEELGTWVGARIALYDVDDLDWDIVLPAESDPENPAEFGKLYVEAGEPAGRLCYNPMGFEVSLRQGGTTTRILSLENCGLGYLSYEISEACAIAPVEGGLLRTMDAGNIVAYVDENSLVSDAISILGYSADFYSDPANFLSAVVGGSYHLVIVSADDVSANEIWNAVLIALESDAKLLIQTPDLDAISGYSIWDYMGLGLGTDLADRGCALTWELPEHPFFNVPLEVPPSVERIEGSFTDYGDNLIPGEDYSVLATFDLYPYPNNAAIVYNEELGIIINSFILSDMDDTDGDDIIDGVELLVDEIAGLLPCEDIVWLSEEPTSGALMVSDREDITVTFDASELLVGEYFGFLMIHTNDQGHPLVYVPCHLDVTEPEPRPMELTVNPENYGCPEDEIVVPIYVSSLDMMGITTLGMTVSLDHNVGQPIDIEPMMGELSSLEFGEGSITFSVSNEFPMPGGGPLALVHIQIDREATVGIRTSINISDVFYNEGGYTTDITTYPGNLYVVSCLTSWYVDLVFTAFGTRPDNVTIGVEPEATNMFDEDFDVLNSPTESFLDAYSDISTWDTENPELEVDIRNGYEVEIHWYIETGDSAGKVEWTFEDGIPLTTMGSLLLYCGDDIVDMKTATVHFYDAGQDIEIVYRATGEQMFTFDFEPGYNMVSIPLYTETTAITELFPGNLGVWRFDSDIDTWVGVSDVEPGVGYIVLFLEPAEFTLWGVPVEELELNLAPGWNLIGTVLELSLIHI